MKLKAELTEGPIGPKLLRMTIPMIGGMFSMTAFNLTDTYFVSRLGTGPLAAMSFTFPVVMIIHAVALGLGMGMSSVISRAIGEGDQHKVQRLVTHGLVLAMLVVAIISGIGLLTIEPVFHMLGATDELMPMIRQYMTIWYLGVVFVIFSMVGNNAIRAAGDTRDPSLIMMFSALLNVILDPIMIFGLVGFPALGIVGAALATVVSRAVTSVGAVLILKYRHQMLTFERPVRREVFDAWKKVTHIAVPTAATNLLFPISLGVFTRLVARYGPEAVAGVGAGSRVESFAMMVMWALSTTMMPFVGQNWGARKFDRVKRVLRICNWFSVVWGLFCFLVFLPAAAPIARLFSTKPDVVNTIVYYLWIIPLGFGMRGVSMYVSIAYNAISRPWMASLLNVIRLLVLYIPCAYIGAELFGLLGVFGGVALSYVLAGLVALVATRWICTGECVDPALAEAVTEVEEDMV